MEDIIELKQALDVLTDRCVAYYRNYYNNVGAEEEQIESLTKARELNTVVVGVEKLIEEYTNKA